MICSEYGKNEEGEKRKREKKERRNERDRRQESNRNIIQQHSAERDTIFTRPERLVNVSTWPIIWNKSRK